MTAENQLPPNPTEIKQEGEKSEPPKAEQEQRPKVDAKTAAKNRSSFFKKS